RECVRARQRGTRLVVAAGERGDLGELGLKRQLDDSTAACSELGCILSRHLEGPVRLTALEQRPGKSPESHVAAQVAGGAPALLVERQRLAPPTAPAERDAERRTGEEHVERSAELCRQFVGLAAVLERAGTVATQIVHQAALADGEKQIVLVARARQAQ